MNGIRWDVLVVAFFMGLTAKDAWRFARARVFQWRWDRAQRVARQRMEACTHERTAFTSVPGPFGKDVEVFRCVHCWAMLFPEGAVGGGPHWVPWTTPPTVSEIARARPRGSDGE